MHKTTTYILLCLLISFAYQVSGQYDYFHGQRNVFSFHINVNPRFIPMSNNDIVNSEYPEYYSTEYEYSLDYGTYYTENNKDGQAEIKKQNANVQLNMFYGRIFKKRVLWGIDMSYQSHNLTFLYKDLAISNFKTTPLFHVIDAQLSFGLFLGKELAPNKHLLQFQAGPKLFYLNTSKEYTDENGEPYEDLNEYMLTYEKPFTFLRLSVNYTRRILLTEHLNLDIGFTSNFGLFGILSPYSLHDQKVGVTTNTNLVKSRLGFETYRNIFYLSAGISYAF